MLTEQTIQRLSSVSSTIATLDVVTYPKRGVKKVARVNVIFGSGLNYLSVINRRRKKIGLDSIYSPQKRPWGIRVNGTPFIEHKGNRYLNCLVIRQLSAKYFKDGLEVSKEEAGLNRKFSPNQTYELGELHPVENL